MSLSPFEKAVSGSLASVLASSAVYPLDLSKTIIQTQIKKDGKLQYKNTVDCLEQILKKKGVLGWYHGMLSSLLGTALQNFSYFYWYTLIKKSYARLYPNRRKSTAIELLLGMLAAAVSSFFVNPVSVITTRQQTDEEIKSFVQTGQDIYKEEGLTGLWKGLKVSLVLTVNPSITYGSYERLKSVFFNGKSYLRPLESFSIGVLSKMMATVATQPLIISKAMLQRRTGKKDIGETGKSDEKEDDEVKFETFPQALVYLYKHENFKGLYRGLAPQLTKGVIVQGLLFMFKDQIDLLFILLLKFLKARKK